ncbi:MAG: peptidyl-prolyl cis-trans isomerase [Verrucomicrobia bacterium]|nr:peptidyl-prolyl cis-trans isomerase [Verrucomicrobiota bacterium]
MIANLMRQNQRWLMIVISTLVIISFIWFYSDRAAYRTPRGGGPGNPTDRVAQLYGRPITRAELERASRGFITAYQLGLPNFVRPEFSGDQQNFLWNLFVVQHEARNYGIEPTQAEIEEATKKIPLFQSDRPGGGFDPVKYARFIDSKLNPRGLTDRELDDLVRTDLQLGRLHQLLDATVVVRPGELRAQYEQAFSKTEAAIIRLKATDLAASINVTDEEVQKYFEENKDHLTDPERRRVQYVVFALSEEQKKLPARERVAEAQKLADKVSEFTLKMTDAGADFSKVAADFGQTVKDTPEFAQATAAQQLKDAGLPETLLSEFAAAAFRLHPQDPNSDALPNADNPDAFCVLHLLATVPARPLTLEEAKPKIVQNLQDSRVRSSLVAKGEALRKALLAAMTEKKESFADAAKALDQTATDLPPFSQDDCNRDAPNTHFPDSDLLTEKAETLNTGELSQFLPTPDGGALLYVKARQPADPAKFAEMEKTFQTQYRLAKERVAFVEWLRTSREAAGVKFQGNRIGAGAGGDEEG